MKKQSAQLAQYWRNNLTDVALQGGEFDPKKLIELGIDEWRQAKISSSAISKIFKESNHSRKAEDDETLDILVYVSVYSRQTAHAQAKLDGVAKALSTIMVKARVKRTGELTAIGNPYVPRTLLEPLDYSNFFVGSMDVLDNFLSLQEWNDPLNWKELLDRCVQLEEEVCDIEFLRAQRFHSQDKVYCRVIDIEAMDAGKAMIKLYDTLLKDPKIKTPLFETYASSNITSIKDTPRYDQTILLRNGHMSHEHPLAIAQRDALAVTILSDDGEIVAVNGPPGTGKTTMLQSVVASLWVNSVLNDDQYPPVIVAASTNNQAVTNVIDSFGKVSERPNDKFAGRWLPDINSYGCYYPATYRAAEAREKGYQIEELWEHVESQYYVSSAEPHYLECAGQAYGKKFTGIEGVIAHLKEDLHDTQQNIKNAQIAWSQFVDAKAKLISLLGDPPTTRLTKLRTDMQHAESEQALLGRLNQDLFKYLAEESIWLILFSFIPTVAYKRLAKGLVSLGLTSDPEWQVKNLAILKNKIKADLETALTEANRTKKQFDLAQRHIDAFKVIKENWESFAKKVGLSPDASLEDFDQVADTVYRQPMFKLTAHYWEGKWIQEIKNTILNNDPDNKGVRRSQRKWRRRAMIAPCSVMTLYRLPSLFTPWEGEDKPLFNFIDLLVIDEAGQVSTAIGGQAFALAKRAIVVGDTLQIEPVRNCDLRSDAGNLAETGFKGPYSELEKEGRTVFDGSVMRTAQTASKYHYDSQLARGMYLYEHRRCVDDIIQYCNNLCYKGHLLPKRGNPQGRLNLPRTGYIQVKGESEKFVDSRRNQQEASIIAKFVAEIRPRLEEAYPNKSLEDIVAIITPFAAQSALIENLLKNTALNKIIVGTVHRMQGAEYPVILFSPTYSGDDGIKKMLDEKPNMLNVAVSRAQDSFIAIGDIEGFDRRAPTPSGKLVNILLAKKDNKIIFH